MPIEFDVVNKWIKLPDLSPSYQITAQEIYNASMNFHDEQVNMDDDPPMRSGGKFALGGGAYSDKIFILQKGWKLKPFSGTYTLTVIGTIIALDDAGDPYDRTVPPDSGTVVWVFQVSSQGIITVSGSGVTQQDKEDIRDLIETQTGIPIKAKTDLLPSDPASESTVITQVATVTAKTDNLPTDPADQSLVDAKIDEKTTEIKGTGFTKDVDSLKQIKEYVDELESSLLHSLQVSAPKSIAQYLEQKG